VNYSERQKLEWLLDYARRLTDKMPLYRPVDVEQLAHRESFPVVRCQILEKMRAPGLLEEDAGGRMKIKLKASETGSSNLNHRERFTVAHELGHGLLIRRFAWNPSAGEEHRTCELLCDQFAANLLIPDSLLPKLQIQNAAEVISTVMVISRLYQVSREVAARRLADYYRNINILCGSATVNAKKEEVIEVFWSTGLILGETLNRRKHIKISSPIGELFAPLLTHGARKAQFVQKKGQDVFVRRLGTGSLLMCTITKETERVIPFGILKPPALSEHGG
jgi:hypothetical protein